MCLRAYGQLHHDCRCLDPCAPGPVVLLRRGCGLQSDGSWHAGEPSFAQPTGAVGTCCVDARPDGGLQVPEITLTGVMLFSPHAACSHRASIAAPADSRGSTPPRNGLSLNRTFVDRGRGVCMTNASSRGSRRSDSRVD
jgi:hypothetical protein